MRIKNFNLPFGLQIFKSFSEEPRLRIIHLIYQNEQMCSSDIEHVLDFTQTKVSRHLKYLKQASIVRDKKLDQYVFYSINDEIMEIIQQFFTYLNKDPVLMEDQETFRILFSNRELAANHIQQYNRWN